MSVTEENIQNWSASVEVGERIVDLITGRIYRHLPNAIKELISNAWDADAKSVTVSVDLDARSITVSDDGRGMSKKELEEYPSIARSVKNEKDKTPGGRPYIGNFGVGIFSALAFCKKAIIETKQEGSDQIHRLDIPTDRWMYEDGKRKSASENKLDIKFKGITHVDPKRTKEHGTAVVLEGIFPIDWNELISVSPDTKQSRLKDLKEYLCQSTPIGYSPDAQPYSDFFSLSKDYPPMNVFFEGERLYRKNITCSNGDFPRVLDKSEHCVIGDGAIICKYMILSPLETVEPKRMGGLQKRMKNVAVGVPEYFDLFESSPKLYGRARYITGEIHILKGLEDELRVDRGGFLPGIEYSKMREFFKDKIIAASDKLEEYAEAEKYLGALAYKSRVPLARAKYGFLADSSVKEGTKRNLSRKTSKENLERGLRRCLLKLGYTIEIREGVNQKISADHENKVVYLTADVVTNIDDFTHTESPSGEKDLKPQSTGSVPREGKFFADIDRRGLNAGEKRDINLLVVLNELHSISTEKTASKDKRGKKFIFQKFPILSSMLMRAAYEQSIHLLIQKADLKKELDAYLKKKDEKNERPYKKRRIYTLSEEEEFITSVIQRDELFSEDLRKQFLAVKDHRHRRILNDNVHAPGKIKPSATSVEDIAKGGLLYFIQEVVDYEKPEIQS